MKKLLLIALLIVGCERYTYSESNPFERYDKWKKNNYIYKQICEEIDLSTIPNNIKTFIDSLRQTDERLRYITEDRIYIRFKKSNPLLQWNEVDNKFCENKWIIK